MARIKYSGLIHSLSGGVGGHVFSRNNVRKRNRPKNFLQPWRSSARSAFRTAATSWRGLTEDQRLAWADYAQRANINNKYFQTRSSSGYHAFVRINYFSNYSGQGSIIEDPPPAFLPDSQKYTITLIRFQQGSPFRIRIVNDLPGSFFNCFFSVSKPFSSAEMITRPNYAPIPRLNWKTGRTYNFTQFYLNNFKRTPQPSEYIFFRVILFGFDFLTPFGYLQGFQQESNVTTQTFTLEYYT